MVGRGVKCSVRSQYAPPGQWQMAERESFTCAGAGAWGGERRREQGRRCEEAHEAPP